MELVIVSTSGKQGQIKTSKYNLAHWAFGAAWIDLMAVIWEWIIDEDCRDSCM